MSISIAGLPNNETHKLAIPKLAIPQTTTLTVSTEGLCRSWMAPCRWSWIAFGSQSWRHRALLLCCSKPWPQEVQYDLKCFPCRVEQTQHSLRDRKGFSGYQLLRNCWQVAGVLLRVKPTEAMLTGKVYTNHSPQPFTVRECAIAGGIVA